VRDGLFFCLPWYPGVLAISRFLIYPETSGSPDIFSLSGRLKQIGKKEYLFIG